MARTPYFQGRAEDQAPVGGLDCAHKSHNLAKNALGSGPAHRCLPALPSCTPQSVHLTMIPRAASYFHDCACCSCTGPTHPPFPGALLPRLGPSKTGVPPESSLTVLGHPGGPAMPLKPHPPAPCLTSCPVLPPPRGRLPLEGLLDLPNKHSELPEHFAVHISDTYF